jgi:hypothetical protein
MRHNLLANKQCPHEAVKENVSTSYIHDKIYGRALETIF